MALDSDFLVDRRRMRRRLAIWRILAILSLAVAAVALVALAVPDQIWTPSKRADHIARLTISGMITGDRQTLALIKRLRKSDATKAVIVSVQSPGGTASGGEALHEALRELSNDKPIVTHISALATSAGYMVATASDHIVARSNAITGSIGVLFQYADASELLDTIGLKIDAIKSSTLKAEPDFYSPPPEEAREVLRQLVDDSYDWFVDLVAERRDLDRTEALAVADGAVFTGRQAMGLKLVDAIGGEETAVAWLDETHDIDKSLPIIDWRVTGQSNVGLGGRMLGWFAQVIGVDFTPLIVTAEHATLDSLVSVWHAPTMLGASRNDSGAIGRK